MRIGTIGSGFIVDAIIRSAQYVEGIEFVSAYSRSMDKAKELAETYHMQYTFDDLDVFLNSTTFDTVYIASPNSLHFSQSMKALEAGKHVIVEKPFTSNPEEARILIDKAKEKHLFLFEAITTIYLPHFEYIKNELGKIGELKMVQLNMSQVSSRYHALKEGNVTNVFNPEFSGGAMMDLNIYNMHLLAGLFGMPEGVVYLANQYKNGVDVSGTAMLKYDRFIASSIGSKDSMGENFVQIQGDEGYIYVDSSSSALSMVKTVTKQGTTDYNVQDKPTHTYEFLAFKKMIDEVDYDKCYEILEHSYNVVVMAHTCLEQIDLHY